jgi:broad specificity phosphatase PhoE
MEKKQKIWCVRHGTALHNILYSKIGVEAYNSPKYTDTHLVNKGKVEAIQFGDSWYEKFKIDIVFVSPLTRTIQTAINIFQGTNVKMVAIDEILEYPQGIEYCNKRKKKSELQKLYPNIDFSLIPEISTYWKSNENLYELKNRSEKFKDFLKTRQEKNICIVSHSTFLKEFLFNDVGDIEEELKHCSPYPYNT